MSKRFKNIVGSRSGATSLEWSSPLHGPLNTKSWPRLPEGRSRFCKTRNRFQESETTSSLCCPCQWLTNSQLSRCLLLSGLKPTLPSFMPPIQQPVTCTMPPALSHPDQSTSKLFQLKSMSRSRVNFVVPLLKRFLQHSELEGKKIAGAWGKEQVNPFKVNEITKIVNSLFPTVASDELSALCRVKKSNGWVS